ncbi:MAG: metal ABC transporter substrate-binding protein [Armatimonadota bacterium]|nr:metal ABC transporter substrate-binding protein [Armatimonadota bacterium]
MRYIPLLAALLLATTGAAHAAVKVVASIPELEAIAREVGGGHVSVYTIARPDQDYHRVEARPSDVARLSEADLFVRVGMDFDLWADALLASARNKKVSKGGPGYVDASERVKKLEVPLERVTGASGDIHVWGNPHYCYDPGYGKVIAYSILLGLRRVDPAHAADYDANYKEFVNKVDSAMQRWKKKLEPCRGQQVVTYHKNFSYFMERFGIREFGNLEPKPGIPPSPAHLNRLIAEMKRANVKAIVVETVYPRKGAEFVAREAGARLAVAPYSVGVMGTRDYISLVDKIVEAFSNACAG